MKLQNCVSLRIITDRGFQIHLLFNPPLSVSCTSLRIFQINYSGDERKLGEEVVESILEIKTPPSCPKSFNGFIYGGKMHFT